MSTSSAPAETAYPTSASLTSRLVRPLGNAVATLATCTPLPFNSAAATWARSGYTQTAATIGTAGSAGSGRLALAHSARTFPGVSWPSSVVRSIIEIAVSIAHCLAVVLMDRLASVAARASAPTRSTPGSPCRKPRNSGMAWVGAFIGPFLLQGGTGSECRCQDGHCRHGTQRDDRGVVRFTTCLAPLRDTMGVRANCICPGLVDTPASRRTRARMTPAELAALPPVLSPADIAAAAMEFLADDTLAGRIMLCRQGGEPPRLLPVTDGQELPGQGGLDHAAEGDQLLLAARRRDELERGGQAGRTARHGQGQRGQAGQVGRDGQDGERHAALAEQRRRARQRRQRQDRVAVQRGGEPVTQVLPDPGRLGCFLGGDLGRLGHAAPVVRGELV